jgi:hypothetical protein
MGSLLIYPSSETKRPPSVVRSQSRKGSASRAGRVLQLIKSQVASARGAWYSTIRHWWGLRHARYLLGNSHTATHPTVVAVKIPSVAFACSDYIFFDLSFCADGQLLRIPRTIWRAPTQITVSMPTMAYSTMKKPRIGVMTKSLELDRMDDGSRPCSMSRQRSFPAWLDSSSDNNYKTSIGSVLVMFLIIVRPRCQG